MSDFVLTSFVEISPVIKKRKIGRKEGGKKGRCLTRNISKIYAPSKAINQLPYF